MGKKKWFVGFILIVMMVTMRIPHMTVYASANDPTAITPEVETTVEIETGGEIRYYRFTPSFTESYTFYSIGNIDTFGYLFDAEMNQLAACQDGLGMYNQFSITYTLEADQTYFWGAKFNSSSQTGSFSVVLQTNHTPESVVTTPHTCTSDGVMTNTCTVCGAVYTEVIPAAHTYENDGFCIVCGEERIVTGTCGENVTWLLDGYGTLTVSGTGEMEDYGSRSGMPWYEYNADIRKIVVEPGVTCIGQYAFSGASAEKVVISDTVASINSYAFCECEKLSSVEVPDRIKHLNTYVFSGCRELKQIVLPKGLTYIGKGALSGCYALEAVTIPDGVTEILDSAFSNCKALKRVEIPDGVLKVSDSLFSGCESLMEIVLPDSVEQIGVRVFQDCYSLTQLVVPENVITMEKNIFARLKNLKQVFFLGDAPVFVDEAVFGICQADFTVYHLANASGWEGTEWHGRPLAVWDFEYSATASCSEPCYQTYSSPEFDLSYTRYNKDPKHRCLDWTVGLEATADAEGYWESTCTLCGENVFKVIPKRAQTEEQPAATNNNGRQDYIQASMTVNSYLVENDDGSLTRVEYTGEQITIETYSSTLEFLSRTALVPELELFGGYYSDGTYHYIVYGQKNPDNDTGREVVRMVRYSAEWNRLESVSLYGANTKAPFSSGSLRMVHYGDVLYVATCHVMFNGHQASMMFSVYLPKMKILDTMTTAMQDEYGYVSHSFNQFITADDGGQIVKIDHGDGHPRSFLLNRYTDYEDGRIFTGNATLVDVMKFTGSTGNNYTGASVGGLEITDSHYMIAGNSIVQDGTVSLQSGQRNIFVAVTPKDNMTKAATEIVWLTDYADGSKVKVSTPHLVRTDSDTYLVMWTEGDALRYVFVNGSGACFSQIYTAQGKLSDCKPVASGKRVIWYVTDDSIPIFYELNLEQPDMIHSSQNHIPGDINGDGNVNNRDAARLMQYLAGWDVEYVEAALDVNGDGKVNNRDAARLMQYLAGWEVILS